jgi:hypothetical protein
MARLSWAQDAVVVGSVNVDSPSSAMDTSFLAYCVPLNGLDRGRWC